MPWYFVSVTGILLIRTDKIFRQSEIFKLMVSLKIFSGSHCCSRHSSLLSVTLTWQSSYMCSILSTCLNQYAARTWIFCWAKSVWCHPQSLIVPFGALLNKDDWQQLSEEKRFWPACQRLKYIRLTQLLMVGFLISLLLQGSPIHHTNCRNQIVCPSSGWVFFWWENQELEIKGCSSTTAPWSSCPRAGEAAWGSWLPAAAHRAHRTQAGFGRCGHNWWVLKVDVGIGLK